MTKQTTNIIECILFKSKFNIAGTFPSKYVIFLNINVGTLDIRKLITVIHNYCKMYFIQSYSTFIQTLSTFLKIRYTFRYKILFI